MSCYLLRNLDFNEDYRPTWPDVREACKNNDPSTAYSQFIERYTQLNDKEFPLLHSPAIKKNRFKQPRMTSALLKSCNKKSRLYLKYLKNPTAANILTLTTYSNKFKQLRVLAKKIYFAEKFQNCENNLQKTWKIVRNILNSGRNSLNSKMFIIDGIETDNALKIANKFNDYFVNVGPTLASEITESEISFHKFLDDPCSSSFVTDMTSPRRLFKSLNNCDHHTVVE